MKVAIAKDEEVFTVKEVAARLKLSDKAVRHLICQGALKAVYMAGRRLRVTQRQLETFLREEIRPA
jgi:excisionase family DNA binding protein